MSCSPGGGFTVHGSGQGSRFRSGFTVHGSRFTVQGSGYRVQGVGVAPCAAGVQASSDAVKMCVVWAVAIRYMSSGSCLCCAVCASRSAVGSLMTFASDLASVKRVICDDVNVCVGQVCDLG